MDTTTTTTTTPSNGTTPTTPKAPKAPKAPAKVTLTADERDVAMRINRAVRANALTLQTPEVQARQVSKVAVKALWALITADPSE